MKVPEKVNNVTKEDLLHIITKGNMRSPLIFHFDSFRYQDAMEALVAVKGYFNQYYGLIVPYLDLIDKEALASLNGIINILYIIYDPVPLLKGRTIVSPGIYADMIISLREKAKDLSI